MRSIHHRSVVAGGEASFRRRRVSQSAMPRVSPAATKYKGLHWLPPELIVPIDLPPEAQLPNRYYLSYYGTGKLIWKIYDRFQPNGNVEWDPSFKWNRAFPAMEDRWPRPTADDAFVSLRLQGPNPWLLHRVDGQAPTEAPPGELFEQNFAPYMRGAFEDVKCDFAIDNGALIPSSITIGGQTIWPDEPGWEQAKRVVNALDLRYTVFVRHLLHSHLIVGQAFALSTFSLPEWHPLRVFLDFFTYGTLAVMTRPTRGCSIRRVTS